MRADGSAGSLPSTPSVGDPPATDSAPCLLRWAVRRRGSSTVSPTRSQRPPQVGPTRQPLPHLRCPRASGGLDPRLRGRDRTVLAGPGSADERREGERYTGDSSMAGGRTVSSSTAASTASARVGRQPSRPSGPVRPPRQPTRAAVHPLWTLLPWWLSPVRSASTYGRRVDDGATTSRRASQGPQRPQRR